jgi:alpha-1,2-mannosyltransferase
VNNAVTAVAAVVRSKSNGRAGRLSIDQPQPRRWQTVLAAVIISLTAFAARLYPMLRGGGLFGLGNYDDGVYYAAAALLTEGLMPYRDFLLLQPPGIAIALAPFAAIGSIFGDPIGMLVGRLGWMVLGAVNALLVARLLLPVSRRAALLGGVIYAVFYPAIYSEHTVLLEVPATTALLISLVLCRPTGDGPKPGLVRLAVAGAVLGAAASIKIWGVVPVLVIVVWLMITHSLRGALVYLGAAAAACAVICLPFFLAAPGQMWRMVVTAQLGRSRSSAPLLERIIDISGLSLWGSASLTPYIAGVLVVAAGCVTATMIFKPTRLFAVLLLALVATLLLTPTWFPHYSGLTAGPAALVAGGGAHLVISRIVRLTGGRTWAGTGLAIVALLLLAVHASPLLERSLSRDFPGALLGRALADLPGCVATDDPSTLIQMNLLRRNVERGCPVQVDLGGNNYVLPHPGQRPVNRGRNPYFQRFCLDFYRSQQAVISVALREGRDYSAQTARIYKSWPDLVRIGSYVVKIPQR